MSENPENNLQRGVREEFNLNNRRSPITNNILMLLGDMLQPQTEGFDHVNLDLSFTQLRNESDISIARNYSFCIVEFRLLGLKKCLIRSRNDLATFLNALRSYEAKSMKLFTETVTKQEQSFLDKTDKRGGFARLLGGNKKEEQEV